MEHTIKAIPTEYAGVNFRSRTEARWAAFFDLIGLKWDYEPFDLEGWAPDFLLRTKIGPVLVEVKPVDLTSFISNCMNSSASNRWPFNCYDKASKFMGTHLVCLLGAEPLSNEWPHMPIGVIDRVPKVADVTFDDLYDALTPTRDSANAWRSAGNTVQWQSREPDEAPRTPFQIFRDLKAAA